MIRDDIPPEVGAGIAGEPEILPLLGLPVVKRSLGSSLRSRRLRIRSPAALILVIVVTLVVSPRIIAPRQLPVLALAWAPLGIAGLGEMMAVLLGGFDLSVGAVISLVNLVLTGYTLGQNSRALLGVAICLAIAIAIGLVNATAIVVVGINPFVATLATSSIILGVGLLYTAGSPQGSVPQRLLVLGSGRVGSLPVSGIIWFAIAALMLFVLRGTTWGRRFYAVGANTRAAELMGIPASRYRFTGYVASAVLAGIAGLVLSAYTGTATINLGSAYMLNSIAVVIIGGATFRGGEGGVVGTVVGTWTLAILFSVLIAVNVPEAIKMSAQGLILLVAVGMYSLQRRQ